MDSQPSRKQLTHDRIVTTAARAIRRGGFHGVGVADIMKEAGLTHGGFYAHFASRNALLTEALERAGEEGAARVAKELETRRKQGASAFRALVEGYLAERHLGASERMCAVAALASEMPRQSPEVREAAAQRVRGLVSMWCRVFLPMSRQPARRSSPASWSARCNCLAPSAKTKRGGPCWPRPAMHCWRNTTARRDEWPS